MSSTITRVVPLRTFAAANRHLFPSDASLQWFCKKHRDELLKAGAISRPLRKPLIVPEAFDQAFVEIGVRKARAV